MRTLTGLFVAGALMLGMGLSEAHAAPGHKGASKKVRHSKSYKKSHSKSYKKSHGKSYKKSHGKSHKKGYYGKSHKKSHHGRAHYKKASAHKKHYTGLRAKKVYKRSHHRVVRRNVYHRWNRFWPTRTFRPHHHTVIYAGTIYRPSTAYTSSVVYATPSTSVPVAAPTIDPVVASYMVALSSPSHGEREHAAKQLGELGDPAAVEHLIGSMLYDTEDDVREEAALALGRIADARAVQPLQHAAAHDTDSDVRRNAIRSLAIFGA
jgi:HEAT repeat protein